MEIITPTGKNKILVIEDEPKKETDSGILSPVDVNWDSPIGTGVVYSVGDDVTEIRPGDKVVFQKYLKRESEIEGKKYLRFVADEIEGILE